MVRQHKRSSLGIQVSILNVPSGIPAPASPRDAITATPSCPFKCTTHKREIQHSSRCGITRTHHSPSQFPHLLHESFPSSTESLLDIIPPKHVNHLASLFRTTTEAINNGIVASTAATRRRLWLHWTKWLQTFFPTKAPDLHDFPRPEREAILAAYAQHVCSGGLSNGKQQV